MPDALPSYLAYKDSGVPWLGDLPAHWEVKRQRNVVDMLVSNIDKHTVEGQIPVRLCNYVDVYKNDRITEHLSFMRATASPDEVKRFRLQVGDVIITKDSEMWNDIGVPALVEYEAPDLVCGYHLAILRPRRGIVHSSFLLRALQSQGVASQYYVSANGVTRYGLSHDAIKSVLVPVPPLDEQLAIARYLDHVDRRIRRAIRAKQKLISLLDEQKQAIIHQAVTRGLDPNVRLKPSGVEWLGEVPEHWEVVALRHRYTSELGKMLDAKQIVGDHLVPYVRNINVQWDRVNTSDLAQMDIEPREYARYTLAEGDLLVCEGGDVGRCAIWRGELALCGFQKAIHRVRCLDHTSDNTRFLYYIMRSAAKFGVFLADGSENTIAHLTGVKLRRHRFAFPPKLEQEAIVAYLDSSTSGLDSAISRIQREIALLHEYRTRLIADVVTGKVDVRAAAQGLPDEVEELEPLGEVEAPSEDEEGIELTEEDEETGG